MISPYKGTFRVSQEYKGAAHQGLDLVGISDRHIYSPVSGTVVRAGWENPLRHSQGWGRRVVVNMGGSLYMYFGHLSIISVKAGQHIDAGALVGVEGSTGYSTGSHLHWEIRYLDRHDSYRDIAKYSGIPNQASRAPLQVGVKEEVVKEEIKTAVETKVTFFATGKDLVDMLNLATSLGLHFSAATTIGPMTGGDLARVKEDANAKNITVTEAQA